MDRNTPYAHDVRRPGRRAAGVHVRQDFVQCMTLDYLQLLKAEVLLSTGPGGTGGSASMECHHLADSARQEFFVLFSVFCGKAIHYICERHM